LRPRDRADEDHHDPEDGCIERAAERFSHETGALSAKADCALGIIFDSVMKHVGKNGWSLEDDCYLDAIEEAAAAGIPS
jgi:hypothetical protein